MSYVTYTSLGIWPIPPVTNTEKEYNMFRTDTNVEATQRNYLLDRVERTFRDKDTDLLRMFGHKNDPSPKSIKELIERITAGKYTYEGDIFELETGSPWYNIEWRDPAVKADRVGYEKAEKALLAEKDKARDAIVLGTATEGKAALDAFTAWKYTT
jgi:hypothetical protein